MRYAQQLMVVLMAAVSAGVSGVYAQTAPSPMVAQLLSTARMWMDKNRPDMARTIVQKALLAEPNQPDALSLLGQVELQANKPDDASKILQQLQQSAPNYPATQALADAYRLATTGKNEVAQIRLLASAGKSEEAVQRLKALFPHGAPSGDMGTFYYKVLSGTDAGRAQALSELNARIKQNPNNLSLKLSLADLLTDAWRTRPDGLALLYEVYKNPQSNRPQAMDIWRRTLTYTQHGDPKFYIWWKRYLEEVPGDNEAKARLEEYAKLGITDASSARVAENKPAPASDAAAPASNAVAGTNAGEGGKTSGGNTGNASSSGNVANNANNINNTASNNPNASSSNANAASAASTATVSTAAASAETPAQRARRLQGAALGDQGLTLMRAGRHDEARALFERAASLDTDNASKWRGLVSTAALWGAIAKANEANKQGKPAEGETYARDALRQDPRNVQATQALVASLLAQQKWQQAEDAMQPLARSGRAQDRAELLSMQADRAVAEKNHSVAVQKLEEAVRLTPDDAWLRYGLAKLYYSMNLPALGRGVMEDGARRAPTADMHYASALFYRYSLDDLDGAAAQMAQIPTGQRSPSMRELAGNIAALQALRQARQQAAEGHKDQARATLTRSEQEAKDDPQTLATIGDEWISFGDPDHGLALVKNWLDAHPDDPAVGARLRYGELLASARRDEQWGAWLAALRGRSDLTAEQRATLDNQSIRLALRKVDEQITAGDLSGARATLAAMPASQQADRRWQLAQIDIDNAAGDYQAGADKAQRILDSHPGDIDARLMLARMDEQLGETDKAAALTNQVLADAAESDVDTRLSVARRLTAQGRDDEALALVNGLRASYPNRSDVTVQSGRVAQSFGDYDQAANLYRVASDQERAEGVSLGDDGYTSAGRALQQLEDRRQPQIATAYISSTLSGDPGISRMDTTQVPIYVRIPDGYAGHYFFHADQVWANSGVLPGASFNGSYQYGKIAAYGNAGLGDVSKRAYGTALAVGYDYDGPRDSWRADLGTTPIGFPVQNIVGGFQYRREFSRASAGFDISRRPVTSSMVSYAGGVDPVTGQKWGGVVRNSVTLRASQDIGRGSLFGSVEAGLLTGTNVPSNKELRLRGGYDIPIFQTPNQRITTGLVGNYWKYSENQHFYTFGNGGYYSPQSYVSVGVPLYWTGRYQKLAWELGGSVGISSTRENTSPYYPTSALMQELAAVQMAAAYKGDPYFGGGTGGGFSYSLRASLEYRVTPHLALGGSFQIDRSSDYAPNVAMLWLRYYFTPQKDPVYFPPRPVRPYSDY